MASINAFYRNAYAASYATQLFGSAGKSSTTSSAASASGALSTSYSDNSGTADRAIMRIKEILAFGIGEDSQTASVEEDMGFITRATGTKNDDTLTFKARSVSKVTAGDGADKISAKGDSANDISGEGGNDQISIAARTITRIYAGADDDTVQLSGTTVLDVDGGAGKDSIKIAAQTLRGIDGGDGNDTLDLEGTRISAAGGKGDDTVTFRQTGGSKASAEYYFARGDGSDTIKSNGPLSIKLGDYKASDLTITTKDNALTVTFKDSKDKLTINLANANGQAKTPGYSMTMDSGYYVLKIA